MVRGLLCRTRSLIAITPGAETESDRRQDNRELHPFQFKFLREFERDVGLSGQNDLLVSGEGRASRTGACSSGCADGCAFAASGQGTDDPAERGTTASHDSRALALAFFSEAAGSGLDGHVI